MTAAVERTLVLVKPDGVARGLSGEIIRRIEAKGYRISALRMRMADPELLARALRRARRQAVLPAVGGVHAVWTGRLACC